MQNFSCKDFSKCYNYYAMGVAKQQICDADFDFTTKTTQNIAQISLNVVSYHMKGE